MISYRDPLFACLLAGVLFVVFGKLDGVVEMDLVALSFKAAGFHDLKIPRRALERKMHFDGPREYLSIVERHVVGDVVAVDGCKWV